LKEADAFYLNIEDYKVFGYHGWYEEERHVGQWFRIDIRLELPILKHEQVDIGDTVNYENIAERAKQAMEEPCLLLEELAIRIYNSIRNEYRNILRLAVKLSKVSPPVKGIGATSIVINPDDIKSF